MKSFISSPKTCTPTARVYRTPLHPIDVLTDDGGPGVDGRAALDAVREPGRAGASSMSRASSRSSQGGGGEGEVGVMADTMREPDQLEATLNEVVRLLFFVVENPGMMRPEHLGSLLRMAATERNRQSDFGAAQMLHTLASQAEDGD